MKVLSLKKSLLGFKYRSLCRSFVALLLLFFIFILTTACTKKKDAAFPEGVGQDLLAISEYDKKTDVLQTLEAKSNVFYTSSEHASESDANKIKLVNYETKAPLFPKDLMLSGTPKHEYKLIYKVTEQKLQVFRNSFEKDMAPEEIINSEKEEDGTLSLPLISYDITGFFRVETAKDENGDRTSRLREQPVTTKSEATHFKISRTPVAEGVKDNKDFIFKANYFDGVWYTSSVIAKTAEEESDLLGFQVSFDSKWDSADKIEFIRTEEKIMGLNARFDKRLKMDNDGDKLNNLSPVIQFPATYVDFDKPSSTDKFKNAGDGWNKVKHWKLREWAIVNLKNVSTSLVTYLPPDPTLTNFKMTDNFFMFSLQFKGLKITMSFLREGAIKKLAMSSYTPKNYFSDDFRYFGYFATFKKALNTFDQYRKENYEINRFINRFHPEDYTNKAGQKRRRIRFVMTEESVTDPILIQTVKDSLQAWDFTFKHVGLTDVDVYLDESQRVSLGDIRFNAINMVQTLTSTSLFGYGPSIADPDTGQIISATTNLHVTSIRDYLISNLRNYLRHKRGELKNNYPLGIKQTDRLTQNAAMDTMLGSPSAQYLALSSTKRSTEDAEKTDTDDIRKKIKPQRAPGQGYFYGKAVCDFESTAGNIVRDIESTPDCKPLIEFAGQSGDSLLKAKCQDSKSKDCGEIEALTKCAQALLPVKIKATMLHELGHNLGLRHNFAASVDPTNFARKINNKDLASIKNYSCPHDKANLPILARSNSVMEYTDFNEDRLTFVGPYDVEAIRFGYADQVMDSKCGVHKLNVSKSIEINLENLKSTEGAPVAKLPIKFCTDEHVEMAMDPLCQRHDGGENALEVVRSSINQYNVLYALNNYRYDKAKSVSPKRLNEIKESLVFNRLKMIYEQWRIHLSAFVGEQNASLDVYDTETYQKVLQDMARDAKYGKFYAEYFEASREIFEFLMRVSFMPDRYCLVKKSGKEFDLIELTTLIKKVENTTGVREISCSSPHILKELQGGGERTLIREVGFYFENQKVSGDAHANLQDMMNSAGGTRHYENLQHKRDELDSYWDIIGSKLDKDLAKDTLTTRDSLTFFAKQKGIRATFLDEPDLREKFLSTLVNRIVYGLSYNDVFPGAADSEAYSGYHFEKWKSEYLHILQTWNYTKIFIGEFGKELMNKERTKLWDSITTREREKINAAPETQKLELKDGSYLIASDSAKFSIDLIARVKFLTKLQKENPAKFKENQQEYDAQLGLITNVLSISL